MLPANPDVLVIGAGAAGIAAARALRDDGLDALVLEARGRVGGRAHTDNRALGAPFDLGATWLHAADENPLRPLAASLGFRTLDHDAQRDERAWIGDGAGGRWAEAAEMADYDRAHGRWMAAVQAAAPAPGAPDPSVAAVAPRGGRWDAAVAEWEGPTIAAAELRDMGLADFLAVQLPPPNHLVERGTGTLLSALSLGLPVALDHPVERLRWDGDGVRACGPWGSVRAPAAVLCVPPTLLLAGLPRLEPALPPAHADALAGLPLGLLCKVGLPAAEGAADRLGLPEFAGLERVVRAEGERRVTFVCWPFGRPHLEGFLGGDAAWALERQGPAALADHAVSELARIFGGRARRALRPERALASDWGRDPWSRGAYSYARPGAAPGRLRAAEPLAGGRLRFAGEHLHPTLAGTLGGAWRSGLDAARGIREAMRAGRAAAGSAT